MPRRDDILDLVADLYGFPTEHLTSPARFLVFVEARATYAHAARSYGHKLEAIASTINRNRATVQHLLTKPPEGLPYLETLMSQLSERDAA
jgi:hypothetical protein